MQNHGNLAHDLRVGPLTNIERLLRSMDCEPGPVFEDVGLKPQLFLDPEARIPYTTGAGIIAACVRATDCEHFGLLLGQWFLTSHLGIAGQLARTAPDVFTALRDVVDNLDLHDRGGVATLVHRGDFTSLGYAIKVSRVPMIEQVYDLSMANICGIMRSLCGMDWNPVEVRLSRAEPRVLTPYRKYFRCRLLFDQLDSAVVFPRELLKRPLTTANLEHHSQLVGDAHTLHDAMPTSFSEDIQDLLRRGLTGSGPHTAAAVAKHFSLHERTLHRRLRAEGTNFRQLLDQLRQAISQHHLAGTALTVSDIALALGYGSTGAFDHAFRRWYGVSPTRWRQSHLVR